MPTPGIHTEVEEFALFLGDQLAGLRAAAHGLTDEQARATPCRSGLSVGGLLEHALYVMGERLQGEADGNRSREFTAATFQQFASSFVLDDDQSLATALHRFDDMTERYLDSVRAADPNGPALEPAAPWDGILTETPTTERFYLMHHIEELARHAGHADIIREQLDGADAGSLRAAIDGRPPNAFVQPWAPDSAGTS